MVHLRVQNKGGESLSLLNRTELASLYDDLGNDYTSQIDYSSISPNLTMIDPGSEARGTILVKEAVRREAGAVYFELSESGASNRKFVLKGYKILEN
ncbi:MAG TPA: hypothetical protein DD435_08525 [Cyanobacteria bacterium UBA8530]|nr:hypothetical protein [Cyanobacteria bacterium UBA8530]